MNNYSIVGVILINAELGCVYLLLGTVSRILQKELLVEVFVLLAVVEACLGIDT